MKNPWNDAGSYEPEEETHPPRFLVWYCVLMLLFIIAGASYAFSHPEGTPNKEWFKNQYSVGDMARGYPSISCCDASDGYILNDDEWRTVKGVYEVLVQGTWHAIEPRKLRDTFKGGVNPFPNALAWYKVNDDGSVSFYCFSPGFVG